MNCENCGFPLEDENLDCTNCKLVEGQLKQGNEVIEKFSKRGFWYGVISIVFSAWTLFELFSGGLDSDFGTMIFVLVDLGTNIPALYYGIKGRQHNKITFIATLIMSITSLIITLIAVIVMFT